MAFRETDKTKLRAVSNIIELSLMLEQGLIYKEDLDPELLKRLKNLLFNQP